MRKLVWFLPFLLTPVFANQCSTALVGVMEVPGGFEGVLANLTVRMEPGDGNVWVDTMPLTKIETQVSARLAREVACELLGINCSATDFYYLLRSDQVLVGGPSAGGPMTVCTLALLLNKSLKSDVVMTGTINPDGSIGPVAGIADKAQILDEFNTFLIPENSFVNKSEKVDLVEVRDVLEAFKYYTGYEVVFKNMSSEELVSNDFIEAMRLMDESLISIASDALSGSEAEQLLNESRQYYESEDYYSSASYSVRSLINSFYDQRLFLLNESPELIDELIINVSDEITAFREGFLDDLMIDHLYDLESFAITMDRVREAESLVRDARESEVPADKLFFESFAEARLITAQQWATLLDYFHDSKEIDFSVESLTPLVLERLESARNSLTYAQTIVSNDFLSGAEEHLNNALEAYVNDELVYALFESLKARAEANLMMELRGVVNVSDRIDFKRNAVVRSITDVMRRGYLPLLSLSFLEYSESFVEDEPYQALLFLSYSKEFSTLGLSINEYVKYYNEQQTFSYRLRKTVDYDLINYALLVVLGVIIGLVATLSLLGI